MCYANTLIMVKFKKGMSVVDQKRTGLPLGVAQHIFGCDTALVSYSVEIHGEEVGMTFVLSIISALVGMLF